MTRCLEVVFVCCLGGCLESDLAGLFQVDPERLQENVLTPGKTDATVMREDMLWVS